MSLIVTAYNEQAVLRDKLENTFALEYPAGRLQVVVVSDGSTDGTDEVARSYEGRPGYLFLRQDPNAGKTAAQNAAVRAATGDVLVFSDANSMYAPDALQQLVMSLAEGVGCVCGELRYTNPERAGAGEGEGYYWRYEQFLKRLESRLGALVGANGSIYAVRRELFEELDPRIISDFILPIRLRRRGHRVVYAPGAVAEEESGRGFGEELRRRRRIVARSLYGLWREAGALNPFAHPLLAFQILSHKVVRWLVPVLLLVLLAAGAAAAAEGVEPYGKLLAAQLGLYGLALLGGLFPRRCGRLTCSTCRPTSAPSTSGPSSGFSAPCAESVTRCGSGDAPGPGLIPCPSSGSPAGGRLRLSGRQPGDGGAAVDEARRRHPLLGGARLGGTAPRGLLGGPLLLRPRVLPLRRHAPDLPGLAGAVRLQRPLPPGLHHLPLRRGGARLPRRHHRRAAARHHHLRPAGRILLHPRPGALLLARADRPGGGRAGGPAQPASAPAGRRHRPQQRRDRRHRRPRAPAAAGPGRLAGPGLRGDRLRARPRGGGGGRGGRVARARRGRGPGAHHRPSGA